MGKERHARGHGNVNVIIDAAATETCEAPTRTARTLKVLKREGQIRALGCVSTSGNTNSDSRNHSFDN